MNGEWNLMMRTSSSTTSMMTAAAHYTKPLLNSLAKYFLCSPHPSHHRINHSQIDAMIRLEKAAKKKMIWSENLVLYPRWGNLILRSKTICLYLKKTFLTSLDLLFLDFSFFNLKNYLQFHEASFSLFCHYPDMQKSCFSHNRDDNLAVLKTHVIFHCFAFCVWKNQDGPSLNLR